MSLPRYPKYKDSGVEWLAEVPEHWSTVRIKFILGVDGIRIGPFGSALTVDTLDDEGAYKVYGQENVIARDYELGYRRVDESTFKKLSSCEVRSGELLVTMMGTSGRCDVVPEGIEQGIMDSHLLRLRLKDGNLGHFLRWAIDQSEYVRFQTRLAGKGSIMHGLNSTIVGNLVIALPLLSEQICIVEFLSGEVAKIDALVLEQERMIELLKEKRQAIISHAVTNGLDPSAPMKESGIEWLGRVPAHWDVVPIKWLSPVRRGASPRPIDDPRYFDENGEFAWVRISDVTSSGGYLMEAEQRLSTLGRSLSVAIAPGDLFVSIAGTVGKPCISGISACIHDGFVYFPSLTIDARFLFRVFEAGSCYGGLGKWGTQLNLNTDTIGCIRVGVPPAGEIAQILDFIDARIAEVDSLATEAHRAIELLQERRAALISAAVTGQIDVRPETARRSA